MSAGANTLLANTALVVALCCASGAAAAPLGRLFFSAEQRGALEHRWQLDAGNARAGDAKPALNGLVWRSSGRSTIWINGVPLYQKSAPISLGQDRRDPAQVDLRLAGRRPLRLRVGETAK